MSVSIFVVALLAYYAIGTALGALKWVLVRVVGPIVFNWTLLCVVIAQPALVCTVFLVLIELCGIWFSIAAALFATYYLYYYQGMIHNLCVCVIA